MFKFNCLGAKMSIEIAMKTSLLIVGGSLEKRLLKAEEYIESPFDCLVIDTTGGMEEIKELPVLLSRAPTQSNTFVCIIKEAQNLSLEAQNALLKILEEPPNQSQIILTSPSDNNLLPTIASRCLKIDLGQNSLEKGSPSQAELSLELLGAKPAERVLLSEKIEPEEFLKFWREVLLNKTGLKQKVELDQKFESLKNQEIINFIKEIVKTSQALNQNVNKKLALEILALETPKSL